jgi:hypothetical protein
MTTIQLHGENLRQAVKWIGTERKHNPKASLTKLIDQACLTYNLTPAETTYLDRFLREEKKKIETH